MASSDINNEDVPNNLQPGDLIEIFRPAYQHWALYLGDGYVINVAPLGKTFLSDLFPLVSFVQAEYPKFKILAILALKATYRPSLLQMNLLMNPIGLIHQRILIILRDSRYDIIY